MSTDPDRFADVTGAILLGGASERMGGDKAQTPLAGRPAAAQLALRLESLCGEVLLVGGHPPPGAPGRRVEDPPGPRSALRGLVGALRAARTEKVLVLATDYYGITRELLLALLASPETDAVVPRETGQIHPLCALYRRQEVLAPAREALAGGNLALHRLVEGLEVGFLEGDDLARFDAGGRALANVNTRAELAAFHAASGAEADLPG
ncbi:MAG: hypothetical protein CL910_03800 [Deltaproteobacteria bacterium]|nr:hypothetical protein [Deltaproteobacteria bacterium]